MGRKLKIRTGRILCASQEGMINAVALFNAGRSGYKQATLLLLEHSLELLYKAAIYELEGTVLKDKKIDEPDRTLVFGDCVYRCFHDVKTSSGTSIINEDEAKMSMVISKVRNEVQHHVAEVSDELLYVLAVEAVVIYQNVVSNYFVNDYVLQAKTYPLTKNPEVEIGKIFQRDFDCIKTLLTAVKRNSDNTEVADAMVRVYIAIDEAIREWSNMEAARARREGGSATVSYLDQLIDELTNIKKVTGENTSRGQAVLKKRITARQKQVDTLTKNINNTKDARTLRMLQSIDAHETTVSKELTRLDRECASEKRNLPKRTNNKNSRAGYLLQQLKNCEDWRNLFTSLTFFQTKYGSGFLGISYTAPQHELREKDIAIELTKRNSKGLEVKQSHVRSLHKKHNLDNKDHLFKRVRNHSVPLGSKYDTTPSYTSAVIDLFLTDIEQNGLPT